MYNSLTVSNGGQLWDSQGSMGFSGNANTGVVTDPGSVCPSVFSAAPHSQTERAMAAIVPAVVVAVQAVAVAVVALPEKALLDFFYLRHGPVTEAYIDELRLQNLEDLDEKRLIQFAKKMNKPRLFHVAEQLKQRIIAKKRTEKKR